MKWIVYLIAETNIIEKKDGRKRDHSYEDRRNTDGRSLSMIYTSILIIDNLPLCNDLFRSLFW